ncbi:MAG TPA: metalloregulator ArsR/SmtB family transcription factor [Longimicrobiaceae bacterium]|nr:metalloregulator ArsR/SmtB family transcription factor [Longimicrobiaceae bacterium]
MLTTEFASSLALKAKIFRGFADPSRLAIVEALRDGSRTVSQIVEITGLTQSNVSNHLKCLLDCGLVSRKSDGRYGIYDLRDARLRQFLEIADDVLGDIVGAVYRCPRYGPTSAAGEGA